MGPSTSHSIGGRGPSRAGPAAGASARPGRVGVDSAGQPPQAPGNAAAPAPDPRPVLKEQARRLLDALLEQRDQETVLRLNPFRALLVEAASKRGPGRPA